LAGLGLLLQSEEGDFPQSSLREGVLTTGFPSQSANEQVSQWRFRLRRQHENAFGRYFEDGSDGTRTRDLRRDRPAF
jgi:hypothetical protein